MTDAYADIMSSVHPTQAALLHLAEVVLRNEAHRVTPYAPYAWPPYAWPRQPFPILEQVQFNLCVLKDTSPVKPIRQHLCCLHLASDQCVPVASDSQYVQKHSAAQRAGCRHGVFMPAHSPETCGQQQSSFTTIV